MSLVILIGVMAVLVISFASWRDLDRLDRKVGEIEARLEQGSTRTAGPPRRGPDPDRVYTVRTEGALFRGNPAAPVTIAEFSDFQ